MARKFRGTDDVKIDAKGRLSIPARHRRIFEAGDPDWRQQGDRTQMVIVYGPDQWNWLEFYTINAIEKIDEEIDLLPRGSRERLWLETLMNGQATEAEIDAEGRLVLPLKLREKIGLTDMSLLTAKGDYIQVWRPDNFVSAGASLREYMDEFPADYDPRLFLNNAVDTRTGR